MRPRGRFAFALALGIAMAAGLLADRYDALIPEKPERYVTDRAGVFGPGQAEALNADSIVSKVVDAMRVTR